MSTRNVCSIGFAQNVSLTDTAAYPSLVGFNASPNKILKIQGRHLSYLTGTIFSADLASRVQAQLKIAAVNWKTSSSINKNSAGISLITNITNKDNFATSTVRGLLVGIEVLLSSTNPNVYVVPFKMSSGVLTLGTQSTSAISTALTDNNAVKLFVEINGQSLNWVLRDISDALITSGSFSPAANYNSLTGQVLPESGYYLGTHSGLYSDRVDEAGNRLLFIDELEYFIGN
jgi:hypothetical protein